MSRGAPKESGPLHHRVSPSIWYHRDWSSDTMHLALYLQTNPHRSTEGLFFLPMHYMLGDMQWDDDRLREPFDQLRDEDFFRYDEAQSVVLLPEALANQQPANPNMRLAAVRRIMGVPASPLDADFMAAAERYCLPLARELTKRFPERFPKRSGKQTAKDSGDGSGNLNSTHAHARAQAPPQGSFSPRSASRDRAREADDLSESEEAAPDFLFAVVSERCGEIAGPFADPDAIAAIVEREMERLYEAIAGAAHPDAYAESIAANYEPRDDVIADLKLLQDQARSHRYGPRNNGGDGDPGHLDYESLL